jgi:hypothetical protein
MPVQWKKIPLSRRRPLLSPYRRSSDLGNTVDENQSRKLQFIVAFPIFVDCMTAT